MVPEGYSVKPASAVGWSEVASRDAVLAQRCAAGDDRAYAELVDEHQRMVVQLAFNLMGDYDDALDVSQEVSDVNPNSAAANSSSGAASPTISTRRISTSVAVLDGQVIALGGLFRDSQTIGKNGIPILSRIPVLGGLFGNHDNRQNRTELIVLLKPQVIRTPDDGRAVTEELRGKLRTLEPFRTHGTIP